MKNLFLGLLSLSLISNIAMAGCDFGFQDSSFQKMSVADVLKKSDNTYVKVQGNIIKRLSEDKYVFKDSTGTVNVEIDNDKWAGQTVTEKDVVELTGEVEKKFNDITLDVDSVKKISK